MRVRLLAVLLTLLLCACGAPKTDPLAETALTINGHSFTVAEYAQAYQYARGILRLRIADYFAEESDMTATEEDAANYYAAIAELAVEQLSFIVVIDEQFEKAGLTLEGDPNDVLDEVKRQLGGEEGFTAYLAEAGITEELYARIVRAGYQAEPLAVHLQETGALEGTTFSALAEEWEQEAVIEKQPIVDEIDLTNVDDYTGISVSARQ